MVITVAAGCDLARRVVTMLARLLAADRRPSWFTADEAYGDYPGLRSWLEDQDAKSGSTPP
ncbi:MAG: hypothetical protein ABR608_06295 [Pseudonocardiaceae bacterium]